MKKCFLSLIILFASLMVFGQAKKKPTPVLTNVNNKEVVLSVYSDAEKIEKLNDYWFEVLDSNAKKLGYAMTSLNYCKDVVGYQNNTPVMIITDTKFNIVKVAILSHCETLSYIKKLATNGFFELWDKKSLKKAQTVELDGYTGATYTAKAVEKNVQFLLASGIANLPMKK